jgi:hypothetical protein
LDRHGQLLRPLRLQGGDLHRRRPEDQRGPEELSGPRSRRPGRNSGTERASFRAFFTLLSQRPWIDRIVREAEFVAPAVFREYYEHLTRGYARGVRQAQLNREVDARYDPEVIAYMYTGIGNFIGMRWADWTAGGQVPDDVVDDVLEVLRRGLPPLAPPAQHVSS